MVSNKIEQGELNDSDLIQGLLNQQTSAINYFVGNYQQFVFVLSVKMLNNTELAEEITQDVMIKCIEKIDQFKGQSKLKTWVYTLARREVLNKLRKNKIDTVELNGTEESSASNGTESQLAQKDLKALIADNFERLNSEQKEVLTLFYLEEYNLKEIAQAMELSEANARVKLYRSRERFKQVLPEKDLILLKEMHYD